MATPQSFNIVPVFLRPPFVLVLGAIVSSAVWATSVCATASNQLVYSADYVVRAPTAPGSIAPVHASASPGLVVSLSTKIIVKLRPAVVQVAAMSAAPGGTGPAPVEPTPEERLQALIARHGVRKAAALSPEHLHARQLAAGRKTQATAATRFPLRAARAPANAVIPDLSTTYVLDLTGRSASEMAATLSALRQDPGVLYAEEDKVIHTQYMTNDPALPDLYAMAKIGAAQAWDVTKGQGAVVAVVDTGIDYNHPDISANIWINAAEIPNNGIDDDHNGFIDDVRGWDFVGSNYAKPVDDSDPMDVHSHGTHVAGTIAAVGDNNLGVVGVAWQAKVMALRALDDSGFGSDSGIARAIIYAADNGVDVINASFAGEGSSQAVADAIDYACSLGVVFVAAAGNDNADVKYLYPANVPNAIAVSALTASDYLAVFSNHGTKIELAAPGVSIRSLEAFTGGYSLKDGTSMAAPHVSGVAALIIARHPTWSSTQVRQALRVSATDLGPAGRDSSFGYGRLNAAQAMQIDEALEAQITSSTADAAISAVTALVGTAAGPGFDHYVVDFGAGESPVGWTTIRTGTTPVSNGNLGDFDPTTLVDGVYTVRLRVYTAGGAIFSDQVQLQVRYLEITSPAPPRISTLTPELKSGALCQITGTARGPSFRNYQLEWAPGVDAKSGWSNVGVVLAGGGLAPVANASLGTWTLPATLTGFHTLRLTVVNDGFSSSTTTTIYAEPALLSPVWPLFVGRSLSEHNVQPVRQPDGSFRFVLSGNAKTGGTNCYSLTLGGGITKIPLDFGTQKQPAVGNLDGLPGDEVVLADGLTLKIFSSDMALVRTITPPVSRVFWPDQTILADLDGDGRLEIIAPARDSWSATGSTFRESGALYVCRVDGTLFSGNYPVTITSPLTSNGAYNGGVGVIVVVADLDGNGTREIILAFEAADNSGYTLKALNADGTPFGGWPDPSFTGQVMSMAAADLDRDGTTELVISEYAPSQSDSTNSYRIRVLNSTGTVRAGWPSAASSDTVYFSIGDLDRDGRNEIVTRGTRSFSVWNDRGANWGLTVTSADQFGNMPPLIADLDGDGSPEITLSTYRSEIRSYGVAGNLKKSWLLFGVAGKEISAAVPLVGDFNNDGVTDLVLNLPLLEGFGMIRPTDNVAINYLTLGTPFNAATSDWTSRFRDPQNSNTLPASQVPLITSQPSGWSGLAGQTIHFAVGASGQALGYQWRKNTINLTNAGRVSGATSATLTITNIQAGDIGDYDVVVTNFAGGVTSHTVGLTVTTSLLAWQAALFTPSELLDPAIFGPNADPDGDGIPNLIEYALGLDPKAANSGALPTLTESGSIWTFTYARPADRTDITYEVQYSTDLTNWSSAGVTLVRVGQSDGMETWQATSAATGDRCFFRLVVTH